MRPTKGMQIFPTKSSLKEQHPLHNGKKKTPIFIPKNIPSHGRPRKTESKNEPKHVGWKVSQRDWIRVCKVWLRPILYLGREKGVIGNTWGQRLLAAPPCDRNCGRDRCSEWGPGGRRCVINRGLGMGCFFLPAPCKKKLLNRGSGPACHFTRQVKSTGALGMRHIPGWTKQKGYVFFPESASMFDPSGNIGAQEVTKESQTNKRITMKYFVLIFQS